MKLQEPFAVYSNVIFLPALLLAIYKGTYVHACIIGLVFVSSILFHLLKETGPVWWHTTEHLKNSQKIFLWIDTVFANLLVVYNLIIFGQKGFPVTFWYAVPLALIALTFFFFPGKMKYDLSQGIWHILAGVVTLLAVY